MANYKTKYYLSFCVMVFTLECLYRGVFYYSSPNSIGVD